MDVHPRVAMAILRHSQIAVTMDIYAQVSTESTRSALLQLGSALGGKVEGHLLLQNPAQVDRRGPSPGAEKGL